MKIDMNTAEFAEFFNKKFGKTHYTVKPINTIFIPGDRTHIKQNALDDTGKDKWINIENNPNYNQRFMDVVKANISEETTAIPMSVLVKDTNQETLPGIYLNQPNEIQELFGGSNQIQVQSLYQPELSQEEKINLQNNPKNIFNYETITIAQITQDGNLTIPKAMGINENEFENFIHETVIEIQQNNKSTQELLTDYASVTKRVQLAHAKIRKARSLRSQAKKDFNEKQALKKYNAAKEQENHQEMESILNAFAEAPYLIEEYTSQIAEARAELSTQTKLMNRTFDTVVKRYIGNETDIQQIETFKHLAYNDLEATRLTYNSEDLTDPRYNHLLTQKQIDDYIIPSFPNQQDQSETIPDILA